MFCGQVQQNQQTKQYFPYLVYRHIYNYYIHHYSNIIYSNYMYISILYIEILFNCWSRQKSLIYQGFSVQQNDFSFCWICWICWTYKTNRLISPTERSLPRTPFCWTLVSSVGLFGAVPAEIYAQQPFWSLLLRTTCHPCGRWSALRHTGSAGPAHQHR